MLYIHPLIYLCVLVVMYTFMNINKIYITLISSALSKVVTQGQIQSSVNSTGVLFTYL
jgi:hypothetical protein